MPALVLLDLVGNGWPWSDQRHLASQHVPELRELVEARLPQHPADPRGARVVGDLERVVVALLRHSLAGLDEMADELIMDGVVGLNGHRSKLEDRKRLHHLPHAYLPEQGRAGRCELHRRGDQREEWRQRDKERKTADDI